MKNIDTMTKCKIGNKILSMLNKEDIIAGSKITITVTTLKNGAIKEIEIKEGDKNEV